MYSTLVILFTTSVRMHQGGGNNRYALEDAAGIEQLIGHCQRASPTLRQRPTSLMRHR